MQLSVMLKNPRLQPRGGRESGRPPNRPNLLLPWKLDVLTTKSSGTWLPQVHVSHQLSIVMLCSTDTSRGPHTGHVLVQIRSRSSLGGHHLGGLFCLGRIGTPTSGCAGRWDWVVMAFSGWLSGLWRLGASSRGLERLGRAQCRENWRLLGRDLWRSTHQAPKPLSSAGNWERQGRAK
jgi:hypothetical protein